MGDTTKIQWAHHTFNAWRGCTKVSPGCKHCYADVQSGRNPRALGVWGPNGTRPIAAEAYWRKPLLWNRDAEEAGERRRVFCMSLGDFFEGRSTMPADTYEAVRAAQLRTFDLIDDTPWLDWLLVTKRPENIPGQWVGGPRRNVWLLTSVEDQQTADVRIPHLLACRSRAPVLGLSCEPLLAEVDLRHIRPINRNAPCTTDALTGETYWPDNDLDEGPKLDWVIVGGESGYLDTARPCNIGWIRKLVDQCDLAKVACFVKQFGRNPVLTLTGGDAERAVVLRDDKGGDPAEWPPGLRVRQFPEVR